MPPFHLISPVTAKNNNLTEVYQSDRGIFLKFS